MSKITQTAMVGVVAALLYLATPSALAQVSKVPAGSTITAWKGFAMTGDVSFAIATRSGAGKVEYWWIVKPWGYTTSTRRMPSKGRIEIPWYGLWHELRVRASEDSVISVRDDGKAIDLPSFTW